MQSRATWILYIPNIKKNLIIKLLSTTVATYDNLCASLVVTLYMYNNYHIMLVVSLF